MKEETTITEDTSAKLLFEDDFDGTTLDATEMGDGRRLGASGRVLLVFGRGLA